jgi:hypothetical protein
MARKRHTAEEIVTKLRQVDVLVSQGGPIVEAVVIKNFQASMKRADV